MPQQKWRKGVYQSTTHLAVALLLLIIFVSVGYFFTISESQLPQQQSEILDELQTNRDTWSSRRPLSFRYVVKRSCFCLEEHIEPYVATEDHGDKTAEFRSYVQTRTGDVLTSPPAPVWIEDLFGLVEQAASENDEIRVIYDPRFGYPSLVDINRGRQLEDANYRYEIRDFEVLEYD